ncbi:dna-pol [Oxyplax ochracea nucleopolyhedrovirus]|uniref:DNA polymerase n=1 Tax=Oxyplax ochracea nucleopolyhedrovirus TaxID=2083176 RepID=A0A2L0WU41_9ABAC|nr:dna-pol [Oxyplax ochracea nucleopolyhedrovirus]AVA31171.1 dna-pol [Oxyplax ochracea nucleopolyhedrovirus]
MKLYTYQQLKNRLGNYVKLKFSITPNDIFRIIRLTYNEEKGFLLAFCNTNVSDEILQFYFKIKLDLYSYKQCYDKHIFPNCRNKCKSYTTFVAPGLKGKHLDKINVIKYKRNEVSFNNSACLDKFLHNVNRVHMQTPFIEGKYMKFRQTQHCENGFVNNSQRIFTMDKFDEDFEIIDESELTASIMPVLACYDIETHSDGHTTSNALVNFIISIGLAVFKNDKFLKICLMYHCQNVKVDQTENDDICLVLFNNEIDMITSFFDLLKLTNPDVILDFNGDLFDLPYIIKRLKTNKMKLKRYDLPPTFPNTKLFIDKLGNKVDTYYFDYYIHIDLYKYFSTDPNQNNVENFQLNTLSNHYLGESKIDLHWTEMVKMYNNQKLNIIAEYNVRDCELPIKLFVKLKMVDSMYSQCILHRLCTDDVICNISHLISVTYFYKAITNTRKNQITQLEEPNPYFFNKNDLSIISGTTGGISKLNRRLIAVNDVPKTAINLGPINQIVKYKGGKVLQPRAGIYKHAFSLDFNSLYLTIMIVTCSCLSNLFLCDDGNVYLNQDVDAINVKLLSELLSQRSKFKKTRDDQNQSKFLYDLYDQMQNSVKRTANSIYGYYGIFFKPLANHITKTGRCQLQKAISSIEALSNDSEILRQFNLSCLNFKVIYGDTDSTFVLPIFDSKEIKEECLLETLKKICLLVQTKVNAYFDGNHKMAFENLMQSLILLKKKKYCYLNSEDKIVFKGWLIKKDMPVFMRSAFRSAIEIILRQSDLNKCLQSLIESFESSYKCFGKSKQLTDYSFSMTYNENPGKKRKLENDEQQNSSPKRKVITIAKHCREILINKGTNFVPGNGDRIPYLLIDVPGKKVTEKAYPVRLFDPTIMRISWMKHMGILCSFMNEMLEIYGDDYKEEIKNCFQTITRTYMNKQVYDKKEPVLVKIKISTAVKKQKNETDESCNEDDEISDEEKNLCANNTFKFNLYNIR